MSILSLSNVTMSLRFIILNRFSACNNVLGVGDKRISFLSFYSFIYMYKFAIFNSIYMYTYSVERYIDFFINQSMIFNLLPPFRVPIYKERQENRTMIFFSRFDFTIIIIINKIRVQKKMLFSFRMSCV